MSGTEKATSVRDNLSTDSQPAKTIIDFIKWYRDNMERLGDGLVNNCPPDDPIDSTKFYSVNFENTEKYLHELKKSGFLSDKYLDRMRAYFKKCDQHFSDHPQNDGPPDGFEFDLVLWSQEYDEDLANIDKFKVTPLHIREEQATLKLHFFTGGSVIYTLSKHGNNWLIDHINY